MYNPARIPSTAQLRALESAWIEACHPSFGIALMEVAGINAARLIMDAWFELGGQVAVVCGRGNNGGDGLVVARHLHRLGLPVTVHLVKEGRAASGNRKHDKAPAPSLLQVSGSERISEHAVNKDILDALGLRIQPIAADQLDGLAESLQASSLIVDALLGTGLEANVDGVYADAIAMINASSAKVVALDLPSGIHSDTGQVMEYAVQADYTVTFGYLKAGLLHYPGAEHAGEIFLVDIGLPDLTRLVEPLQSLSELLAQPKWWLATAGEMRELLPPRRESSHKGTYGRLFSLAGGPGMTGSALLAGRSALRTGVGLSVLGVGQTLLSSLPAQELIYRGLPQTGNGAVALAALEQLLEEAQRSNAFLIGPGLGDDKETVALVGQLLESISIACIVDADGLNAVAKLPDLSINTPAQVVFTPHPKELSRLLNLSVEAIQADRTRSAEAAVERFGVNVILKGAHTVVATVDHGTYIIPTGNSGMATAGCGDVLSGMVGAFLAAKMDAGMAAVAAAYLHGLAGDLAAQAVGAEGLVAGDVVEHIPQSIAQLRSGQFTGTPIEQEVVPL